MWHGWAVDRDRQAAIAASGGVGGDEGAVGGLEGSGRPGPRGSRFPPGMVGHSGGGGPFPRGGGGPGTASAADRRNRETFGPLEGDPEGHGGEGAEDGTIPLAVGGRGRFDRFPPGAGPSSGGPSPFPGGGRGYDRSAPSTLDGGREGPPGFGRFRDPSGAVPSNDSPSYSFSGPGRGYRGGAGGPPGFGAGAGAAGNDSPFGGPRRGGGIDRERGYAPPGLLSRGDSSGSREGGGSFRGLHKDDSTGGSSTPFAAAAGLSNALAPAGGSGASSGSDVASGGVKTITTNVITVPASSTASDAAAAAAAAARDRSGWLGGSSGGASGGAGGGSGPGGRRWANSALVRGSALAAKLRGDTGPEGASSSGDGQQQQGREGETTPSASASGADLSGGPPVDTNSTWEAFAAQSSAFEAEHKKH